MNSQEHESRPVGDELTAWRRLLKRAHRAEEKVRELRQRITELEQREGR